MKKYVLGLSRGILLLSFLVACLSGQAQEQVGAGESSIQGQVRDADSAAPIPHARVLLVQSSGIPVGQTITTLQGTFLFVGLFRGLPPGDAYELWVTCQGYQDGREIVRLPAAGPAVAFVYLRRREVTRAPVLIEPPALDDLQVPKKARKEYEKGVKQLRQRNWQKSRRHFEAALALYPRYASAQVGLGTCLLKQGELGPARRAFEAAIAINANYAAPRLFLGEICNAEHQYAEAVIELRKALTLNPDSWFGHFEISRAYLGLGDVAHAEEHIIRAQELLPGIPEVHLMRANVYLAREDYAGALKEIDEFLALVPAGPTAENVRQRRRQIQEQLTKTRPQ